MPTATMTVPPFTTRGGGGGGDPHFTGFDGVRFDYHGTPGQWYLLWYEDSLRVEAYFDLEPEAEKHPSLHGTTFVTKLKVFLDREVFEFDNLPESWGVKEEFDWEQKSGLIRGLPPQLQFIGGEVIGAINLKFSSGDLVTSCMRVDTFYFLNVGFNLKKRVREAAGVLGQTLLAEDERVPNDCWILR